jgi:hypothetical protein
VGHHHFSWSNRSTQQKGRLPRPRFHFLRIITIPPLYRDMEMVRIGLWEYPGSTNGGRVSPRSSKAYSGVTPKVPGMMTARTETFLRLLRFLRSPSVAVLEIGG